MSKFSCFLPRYTLILSYVTRVATSLCRLLFEKAKVNDILLFMTILSTDLKALKRRGYNGWYYVYSHPRVPAHAYISSVDRILKQQQQDKKLAEEARRSRYIGSETTDSVTTPIPQPVAPQPVRADHPDSIATRSKSPTRPSVPGGWKPNSPPPYKAPPPAAPPSIPERPSNELTTTHPSIPPSPSPSEPPSNASPIGNALQNWRRKFVSHMPPSELVRSSPSPQLPQYAPVPSVTSFVTNPLMIGIRGM